MRRDHEQRVASDGDGIGHHVGDERAPPNDGSAGFGNRSESHDEHTRFSRRLDGVEGAQGQLVVRADDGVHALIGRQQRGGPAARRVARGRLDRRVRHDAYVGEGSEGEADARHAITVARDTGLVEDRDAASAVQALRDVPAGQLAPHPVVAADVRHDAPLVAGGHHREDRDSSSVRPRDGSAEGDRIDGIDQDRRDALRREAVHLCSLARAVTPGRDDAHIELQAVRDGGHAAAQVRRERAGIGREGDADPVAAVSVGAARRDRGGQQNVDRCSHTAKLVNALDFRDALFYTVCDLQRGAPA